MPWKVVKTVMKRRRRKENKSKSPKHKKKMQKWLLTLTLTMRKPRESKKLMEASKMNLRDRHVMNRKPRSARRNLMRLWMMSSNCPLLMSFLALSS